MENNALKRQIASIIKNKRTYSSTVTASQVVTLATPLTDATASVVEPAGNGQSSDLKLINARIDEIKQEAVSRILLLKGKVINGKTAQSSDTDTANDVLRSALQPGDVTIKDIIHLSIQGK